MSTYVTVSTEKYVDIEVDVDVEEIVRDASTEDLIEIHAAVEKKLAQLPGSAPGPFALDRVVERAYFAARAMADCPQAIRDLLWQVHGRAI